MAISTSTSQEFTVIIHHGIWDRGELERPKQPMSPGGVSHYTTCRLLPTGSGWHPGETGYPSREGLSTIPQRQNHYAFKALYSSQSPFAYFLLKKLILLIVFNRQHILTYSKNSEGQRAKRLPPCSVSQPLRSPPWQPAVLLASCVFFQTCSLQIRGKTRTLPTIHLVLSALNAAP